MKTEFEVTLQKDIRVRLGGIVSKRIWRVWPVLWGWSGDWKSRGTGILRFTPL